MDEDENEGQRQSREFVGKQGDSPSKGFDIQLILSESKLEWDC